MSDTIIRVENLGKKYIIGHQEQERYTALRDVISNGAKGLLNPFQKGKSKSQKSKEEFWALKDVSFEIKQGDRVGIIGRNGAGKSTLLKILSRITEPTTGRINIKGRIASLLEVGTGFHPELTGRENIYLNGAILGMSKVEIKRNFDEIVAFAEVEKFLDTPVKRYSSGMYVRLAFAVAAHLEPEILIVDEVLAVGDAQFQKKCLGKMEEVGKEGRTVIFVSHNMGAIKSLCSIGIFFDAGQVSKQGDINTVISHYLTSNISLDADKNISNNKTIPIALRKVILLDCDKKKSSEINVQEPFYIQIIYEVREHLRNVELGIRIDTSLGQPIFTSHQSDCNSKILELRQPGIFRALIEVPGMFLVPGQYLLTIGSLEPLVRIYENYENIIAFNVNDTGTKFSKYKTYSQIGVIFRDLEWKEEKIDI